MLTTLNFRAYGQPPFTVVAVHGGPGAPGTMAPVARELRARGWSVLEPMQTADSLDGQAEELSRQIEERGSPPVTVIGHSWGAMLAFITAARYPPLFRKLILVCSGVFEERYADAIMPTRLSRLSEEERHEVRSLIDALSTPALADASESLARLGALLSGTDTFEPLPDEEPNDCLPAEGDTFQKVWNDAVRLRHSGELLELGSRIRCPVVAIHGDYDPHPADGVSKPLSAAVQDFRFILVPQCGHEPWRERHARDRFFALLDEELRRAS